MKKAIKRSLSLLLAIAIIFSSAYVGLGELDFSGLFAVKAQAASSGTCGDNLTWTLDDEGVLTISGTGDMTNYIYNSYPYRYVPWSSENVKNVVIDSGVTRIGSYAFYKCKNLTSVTIPDSVTSIGSCAFHTCSALTSVTIPDSVTGIGEDAFYNCNSLKGVYISDIEAWCSINFWGVYSNPLYYANNLYLNGELVTNVVIPDSITSIDCTFPGCTSLTSVTIPDSVTSIGNDAFSGCTSLPSITIPDSVTSIGKAAFSGCTSLPTVTIPDSVTSIGMHAFYGCTSLTSVTIPDSVTSIGMYAFYGCTSLNGVYITDIAAWCDISFVYSFDSDEDTYYCYANPLRYAKNLYLNGELVTDLVIPDGVASISDFAFQGCTSITSVTIPDSVTSAGIDAFVGCENLTGVYITDIAAWCGISFSCQSGHYKGVCNNVGVYIGGYDYLYSRANPLYYAENLYLNGKLVTDVVIPDGVTNIGGFAFSGYDKITSVTISDSVTNIGKYAFNGCTNITSVTISDSVTNISEWAFAECTSITSITIPDSVTSIGERAFYSTSLTSVTIGSGVKSIHGGAFIGCTNLVSVYITDIAAWCGISFEYASDNPLYYAENLYLNGELVTDLVIPDGVTRIGGLAFSGYDKITSVTIPDSVTSIGEYAFDGCTSLPSITIPDSVTSIGEKAFYGCTSLNAVYISDIAAWCSINFWGFYDSNPLLEANNLYLNGELVTELVIPDSVTSIGEDAFSGCTSLASVTIPDSVTSIGEDAFSGCDSIKSIVLPGSVTDIPRSAFYKCDSLQTVTLKKGVKSIGEWPFGYCENLTSILIPDTVTSIDDEAFVGCDNLTIYGVVGSYAQTYANNHSIPFRDISEFGSVDLIELVVGGLTFKVYNKNTFLEVEDVLDIISDEVNPAVKNPSITYGGKTEVCEQGDDKNSKFLLSSKLTGRIVFSKADFYDYVIPDTVITNFKNTGNRALDVYLTKDRKDGKPYISTVFGRVHNDKTENIYEELQTNSLKILKDVKYDIIITADLKGEDSATYYLSQDENHKISNFSGVFSQEELYSVFDEGKPIYAYVKTSSGKATEPVTLCMEKKETSSAVTKLFTSNTFSLLGSDFAGITISDDIPIIGGTELSMGGLLEFPIGVELEGERLRISIGQDIFKYSRKNGEEEWTNYKKACKETGEALDNADSLTKSMKKFNEQMEKWDVPGGMETETTKGVSVDASYLGYIEGYLVGVDLIVTEFSGTIAAAIAAQLTVNGSVGPAPAYFYVNGGVETALGLKLAKKVPDSSLPFDFTATLSATPNITIGGGVGTKGVVSAGIYGSAKIPTTYAFQKKHLTMSLTGSIGVEGEILIFKGKRQLLSGTVNVLDHYFGTETANLSDFSQVVFEEMQTHLSSSPSKTEYSLASRDYASETSGWLAPVVKTNDENSGEIIFETPVYSNSAQEDMGKVTATDLQTAVYKNSQTQLVQFGDKMMLAYIEDFTDRDTYNRYRLMYTVYDPSTNVWTEPKAVCDSGKMDVSPSLATDGESVYIAWQTVNTTATDSTEEALLDCMNNMEIYSAKYDEVSDSFVNVTQHTSNSTYDYAPYVTVENGSATVYWINAASTNFAAGEMSIHSSTGSDDTILYDNMNYVVSVKASGNEVSYSMDVDGNIETVTDIKLFTNGTQVGEGVVNETATVTNYSYGKFNGAEKLFYSDGSTVYYIDNGSNVACFNAPRGIADSLQITTLNGNPAVIYTELTDMGSELCISTFENDVWSEPVYLTDFGKLLSNVDTVSVNGKIYTVFNKTHTTEITDEETGDRYLEYGQTDLCMLSSEGYYDLRIAEIGYDESDMVVGTAAPVIVVMENKGTEKINNVNFTIFDDLGYSATLTKDVALAPGAIESVELEYTAPSGYAESDLTVTAEIVDCSDIDSTNNTTTALIGRTDISAGVTTYERIGDVYKIRCEIKNDSLVDAENVTATISYDIYEKPVLVGTLEAKTAYIAELLVAKSELVFDENGICTLTFGVSTDSEEVVFGNNENTITVENSDKLTEHEHNFVDNVCEGCGMAAFLYETTDDGIIITGCNLTGAEIVVPETIGGVTVTGIGASAFAGNVGLTSVIIPATVVSIGDGAFSGCTDFKYIFFKGTEDEWAEISVGSDNTYLKDATVHYETTGHTYSTEWTIDVAPTCTEPGSKSYHCNICDNKTEITEVDATGHSYSTEWTIDVVPTCTEPGSKSHHCTICDDKTDVTEIAAEHIYGEWVVTKEPTCTEDGEAERKCSVCGGTQSASEYSDTVVVDSSLYPESSHNYANNISETYDFSYPNATSLILTFSSSTYTESGCDYICIYDETGALYGKYSGSKLAGTTITLNGSAFSIKLTSDGSSTYYGFSFDSIVANVEGLDILKAHHSFSEEWTIDVAPTCTETGSKSHHCLNCDEIADVTEIAATGHSYGDWVVTKEPTCTEDGEAERKCSVCGGTQSASEYSETVVVEAGLYPESSHNYANSISETYDFSYPNATSLILTFSSSTYTESNYDYIYVYDETGELYGEYSGSTLAGTTITLNGSAFSIELTSDYSNTYYGFSFDSIIANVDGLDILKAHHSLSDEWTIDVAPTCTEPGSKHSTCTVCGETETEEIPLLSHEFVNGICTICNSGSEDFWIYEEYNDTIFIYGCNGDVSGELVIPEFINNYPVVGIEEAAFSGCTDITSVVFPETITSIGACAFDNCLSLISVEIPEGVTSIGTETFHNCEKLTNVIIPDSMESIGYGAFSNCSSLESITIPDSVTSIGESAFYECTALNSVKLSANLTSVSNHTFCNCSSLTSIEIPDSVTSIGESAFYECTALNTVKLSANLTSVGDYAFYDCSRLTSIELPDGVTDIGDLAFYMSGLDSIVIPSTVTSIGESSFELCYVDDVYYAGTEEEWAEINISDYNDGLENSRIHYSVTDVENHISVIETPPTCTEDGKLTKKCDCGYESVDFDETKPALGHSYVWVFDNESLIKTGTCSECGDVIVEGMFGADVLTFTLNNDGTAYTVTDCLSNYYGEVPIPETYNELPVTAIGTDAFRDCTGITSVVIPCSVTSIGGYAFSGCSGLKYVFYEGDEEAWGNITIGSGNTPLTDTAIHYNSTGEHKDSDEWIIDSEATCTEKGSKHKECTVCGEILESVEIFPRHIWSDGFCTVCGAEQMIESAHPYESDMDESWTIYEEGATRVAITFSENTETEDGYDYIHIYNGDGNKVGSYSGTELAGKRIVVLGDTVTIRLVSDSSVTCYGFALDDKEFFYDECYHSETEILNYVAPNCTYEGYTGDTYCVACGVQLSEGEAIPIDSEAHEMYTDVFSATCIQGGYTLNYCMNCDYSYKTDETEPVDKHNYDEGVCLDCGEKDPTFGTEEIAVGDVKAVSVKTGETVSFVFKPEKTGFYSFRSVGPQDVIGTIYDIDMNEVSSSSNGGTIVCDVLNGGEAYFVSFCSYSDDEVISFELVSEYAFYFSEGTTVGVTEDMQKYLITDVQGSKDASEFITLSENGVLNCSTNEPNGYMGTDSYVDFDAVVDGNWFSYGYTLIVAGDINGDSFCDVTDAFLTERMANGHKDYTPDKACAANGCINETIDVTSYQNVVNIALSS